MANVTFNNGQFYATSPLGEAVSLGDPNRLFTNPKLMQGYQNLGLIKPVSAPAAGNAQPQPTYQRPAFTPNQFTNAQLQGMGNMQTPQWMMDAYTQKIGGMGGNANPPVPFNVTQSGFPGMGMMTPPQTPTPVPTAPSGIGGKNAPYASIIQGLQGAVGGATNAAKGAV